MSGIRLALTVLFLMFAPATALAAAGDVAKGDVAKGDVAKGPVTKGDVAKAEADRKKPLQRCDQLNDQAEVDCLKKARERIVEARQKRENDAKAQGNTSSKK